MPGIAKRPSDVSHHQNDESGCCLNPLIGGDKMIATHSYNESPIYSDGFWSNHRDGVSYNQLEKFWCGLHPKARQNLLRLDKQTLFEHARKNMYCSRCNGLLLEGFVQIAMYGKSLQHETAGVQSNGTVINGQNNGELCTSDVCQDDALDPSVHPWGGLTTFKDGTLTILDCYLYSKSLKGLENVFDSAHARERERELLYPDACGGGGRGWISQGVPGYGRGHGIRETCALHTARLSVEILVDFWSALGDDTRRSLLRMKEEDFIERLMYRFDSKKFCRDCRRNVIREFKELKELKCMKREPRCTKRFCAADTAIQYEVSCDAVQADWHQTFSDAFGTYHHFEWAIGTGEGKSDILEFENVGLTDSVHVNGLDLNGLHACFITLRAWKIDGRCKEISVKAHALRDEQCVHHRLVVGDGFVTISRGNSITRFFERAEEVEEEEDDDSMENELDGECSRPPKHAKSPELAREFLLDAATVIFKEQVEKAFREGTARQNAHNIFVCLAMKLLEERVHVACKEITTLEKQMKLLEEEESEKRKEEEQKDRRRIKEREKKLRRKERLREKDNRERKYADSKENVISTKLQVTSVGVGAHDASIEDSVSETGEVTPSNPLSPDIQEDQLLTADFYWNTEGHSEAVDMGAQPENIALHPQIHYQNLHFPVFQAPPTMGYCPQSPQIPWTLTSGFMNFPHSSQYLFPNMFGYSMNVNPPFMPYGGASLPHMAPPLFTHANLPVFLPMAHPGRTKEYAKVCLPSHVGGWETQCSSVVDSTEQIPAAAPTIDKDAIGGRNGKSDNGFSLFHFGGPVALSTGYKLNSFRGKDGDTCVSHCPDDDVPYCNKKEPIEEYNLFAANGISFSFS